MTDDVPGRVSIRCADGGNEWRYDSIQAAANLYGVNKSDAVAFACEDVRQLVQAVEAVLDRDDLTPRQKQEIADTFRSRGMEIETESTVTIELG